MGKSLEHRKTVAYVACGDERRILALELSPDGTKATVLQDVTVPGADTSSDTSMPLTLHPTMHFLYATVRAPPFPVACFALDPASGQMHFRSSAQLADNMVFMQIDRSGQFLLAASYSESTLSLHSLNKKGDVCSSPVLRWETQRHPHSIAFDPSNRSFYVPCLGSDLVLSYQFDAGKGHVSSKPVLSVPLQRGAGPRHLVVHPDGRYLFVLNELQASIAVVDLRKSSGIAASVVQTITLGDAAGDDQCAAADIHLTPQRHFLYASERHSNLLTGFSVDPNSGSLARIGAWETEPSPRSFAIDPTGRLLVTAGQDSNHVSFYSIDTDTGALTRLFRQATPGNPSWIEVLSFS